MNRKTRITWITWIVLALAAAGLVGDAQAVDSDGSGDQLSKTKHGDALEIASIYRRANGVTVTWTSPLPEQAYTLQVSGSIAGSNWTAAPTRYRWPRLASHWTEAGGPTGPARFYRVLSEPIRLPDRGKLLSVTLCQTLSLATAQSTLSGSGLGSVRAQWSVKFYKLLYETVDPIGLPITASGALYVPQGPTNALPLVSLQRGTLLPKSLAASAGNVNENPLALMFATAGYVAALPDYIGMGDSPGYQPYDHARSEAVAVLDMLRALRTWCATNAVRLNSQLFLVGYSQGGGATMAAHREIETYCTEEFTITASAPMAGPYDLSGVMLTFVLTNRNYSLPFLVPHLITAYLPIYHLADTIEDLLAPPYDRTLPPLLDGLHGYDEINRAMPKTMFSILRPDYFQALLTDPNHPLRCALRDNDTYAWTPRAPMHLYHCRGDEVVPYENSVVAYQSFTSSGACPVELIDPGAPRALSHMEGYVPCYLAAKQWFDSLKR